MESIESTLTFPVHDAFFLFAGVLEMGQTFQITLGQTKWVINNIVQGYARFF